MPSFTIWPPPYKPSKLSITSPAFPSSPISPFSMTSSRKPAAHATSSDIGHIHSPPPTPLAWLWKCYNCQSKWPLGVTRRCLIDGHAFCSGVDARCRLGKRKNAHRNCGSEFDYRAWHARNNWRRHELSGRGVIVPDSEHRDCWYWCEYPSQCNWEPTQHKQLITTMFTTSLVSRS
jgi:hypothetical protein